MEKSGTLRKMFVENGEPVNYWLNLDGEAALALTPVVGTRLHLEWTGEINCIHCGKSINKTFGQGFCYDCFTNAPESAPCIIRPELCEAHLGRGRDPEWENLNHNQPHVVYLAQTSGIKVGVTRRRQIPTRWIDQGARRTVAIAEVPYRQLAGQMEIELKQYLSDRTDWRKMLTDIPDSDNIAEVRDMLISFLPAELKQYALPEEPVREFCYPIDSYPAKISTIRLEDVRSIRATLTGIRGQYLYFDGGNVINLRKYSGYRVGATPI